MFVGTIETHSDRSYLHYLSMSEMSRSFLPSSFYQNGKDVSDRLSNFLTSSKLTKKDHVAYTCFFCQK